MVDAQGHVHGDDGIEKLDIRVEGCSSKGPAWRVSAIAGHILENYANEVRSFDLVGGDLGHLEVYFSDDLVLTTKENEVLDTKHIEDLITAWKDKH